MIVRSESLSILDFLKRLRKKFDILRDLTKISVLVIEFTKDHLRIYEECGKEDDFYNANDENIINYVFMYLTTFLKFQDFLKRNSLSTNKVDNAIYEVIIEDNNSIIVNIPDNLRLLGVSLNEKQDRLLPEFKNVSLDLLSVYELTLNWQRWIEINK